MARPKPLLTGSGLFLPMTRAPHARCLRLMLIFLVGLDEAMPCPLHTLPNRACLTRELRHCPRVQGECVRLVRKEGRDVSG